MFHVDNAFLRPGKIARDFLVQLESGEEAPLWPSPRLYGEPPNGSCGGQASPLSLA